MIFSIHKSPVSGRNIECPKNNTIENLLLDKFFSGFFIFLATLLLLFSSELHCIAQQIKNVEKFDSALVYAHSPRTASFYSAVLPGLGQAYNKKYWKIPVVYSGLITFAYFINYNNTYYTKFKKAYIYRKDGDPSTYADNFPYGGSNASIFTDDELKSAMDYHRRYRDLSALMFAGFYLLNIIDATVDAYLFDYDVDQNLSLNIKPAVFNSPYSVNFGVSCSVRF
jgi:hypothetical protein